MGCNEGYPEEIKHESQSRISSVERSKLWGTILPGKVIAVPVKTGSIPSGFEPYCLYQIGTPMGVFDTTYVKNPITAAEFARTMDVMLRLGQYESHMGWSLFYGVGDLGAALVAFELLGKVVKHLNHRSTVLLKVLQKNNFLNSQNQLVRTVNHLADKGVALLKTHTNVHKKIEKLIVDLGKPLAEERAFIDKISSGAEFSLEAGSGQLGRLLNSTNSIKNLSNFLKNYVGAVPGADALIDGQSLAAIKKTIAEINAKIAQNQDLAEAITKELSETISAQGTVPPQIIRGQKLAPFIENQLIQMIQANALLTQTVQVFGSVTTLAASFIPGVSSIFEVKKAFESLSNPKAKEALALLSKIKSNQTNAIPGGQYKTLVEGLRWMGAGQEENPVARFVNLYGRFNGPGLCDSELIKGSIVVK